MGNMARITIIHYRLALYYYSKKHVSIISLKKEVVDMARMGVGMQLVFV